MTQPPGSWGVAVRDRDLFFFAIAQRSERAVRTPAREKILLRHIWLDDIPEPTPDFLQRVEELFAACDIAALWQTADDQTHSLADLAARFAERMEAPPTTLADATDAAWLLAVLKCVVANPIYFYHQNHRIIPRPRAAVEKAQASLAHRRARREQTAQLVAALQTGACPPAIVDEMDNLLYRPDRHHIAYLALKEFLASAETPADEHPHIVHYFLTQKLLPDLRDYWQRIFELRWTEVCGADVLAAAEPATAPPPQAFAASDSAVAAFAIDDEGTIEIDDAFSVQPGSADGEIKIGVHIAVPSLWMDVATDSYARARMTSVYFPDVKWTMLPRAVIAACSLSREHARPALSLYFYYHPQTQNWRAGETAYERVRLAATVTPTQLAEQSDIPPAIAADFAQIQAFCQYVRPHTQPPRHTTAAEDDDTGGETEITASDFKIAFDPLRVLKRPRNAVGNAVETMMRLTNQTWAAWLHAQKAGGIFRANGKLHTKPPRDQPPYMWLTSPLRRYVDLQNQRLLLSQLDGRAAPQERWRALIPQFDRRYHVAHSSQRVMERYWALKVLTAAAVGETPLQLTGTPLVGGRVRLADYPLVARDIAGKKSAAASTLVQKFRLIKIDEVAQTVWVEAETQP